MVFFAFSFIFFGEAAKKKTNFFLSKLHPPSWVRGREGEGRAKAGFLLFNFCFAAKIDFLAKQKSKLKSKLFSFIKEKRRESKSNEKKSYFSFNVPLPPSPPLEGRELLIFLCCKNIQEIIPFNVLSLPSPPLEGRELLIWALQQKDRFYF